MPSEREKHGMNFSLSFSVYLRKSKKKIFFGRMKAKRKERQQLMEEKIILQVAPATFYSCPNRCT
jgi:hypothetical protein